MGARRPGVGDRGAGRLRVFDSASAGTIGFVLAYAGGAVLTMLADTMMPEAFDNGGDLVGLATTAGFAVAFALHLIE